LCTGHGSPGKFFERRLTDADKAKGAIKDAAGKVTGDTRLEAEGKLDKAKGAAHNVAGDVKDAAHSGARAVDNAAKK
jgi:uncharacterized protein YjbJ (UPF0337 family)